MWSLNRHGEAVGLPDGIGNQVQIRVVETSSHSTIDQLWTPAGLGRLSDVANVAVPLRRHRSSIPAYRLTVSVFDGDPTAVVAKDVGGVAPFDDEGADEPGLRVPQARRNLDQFVGGAAHGDVEANLRDTGEFVVA